MKPGSIALCELEADALYPLDHDAPQLKVNIYKLGVSTFAQPDCDRTNKIICTGRC